MDDISRESPAPHPGSAERLHEYWVHGPGAAEIRWGTHGDFDRCTRLLEEHAHFTPEQAHGYCNLAHHAALGIYPATHAAEEKHAGRSGPLDMSAAAEILATRTFDPAKHARVKKGQAGGGEFAPSSGSSSSSSTAKGKTAKSAAAKRPTPTNAHPVGMGETGQRVHDLQERLNALGAHLKVDGIFGPKTRAAVTAFQKSHGLKVDALVGPKTTAALRLKAKAPAHKPTAKPAVKAVPAKQLVHVKRDATGDSYDQDGLDASWDDLDGLPDLTGLDVADFEAITEPADAPVSRAMPKLGTGARFAALKARLAAKGASNPGALAAYIGRKKFGKKKFTALAGKARGHRGGGMHRSELVRDVPLQDYHIVRAGDGGDGRTVEAYMTVFDEATEIRDHQGRYREVIDRAAFNKRINDLQRSRNGFAGAKVFYNHGMTIHGSPSDRYSMPVAVCEEIRIDARGPVTRSRYLDTPLGNEVLEMWRSGAVTAQSFTGAIIRSSPELRRGETYQSRGGQLQSVRRLELGLKEYGPTPFPAYQGAELVGVRMAPLGAWQDDEDEIEEAEDLDRFEVDDEALPPDEEAAPGGPLDDLHLSRDHAHRALVTRTQQMLREEGIKLLDKGW